MLIVPPSRYLSYLSYILFVVYIVTAKRATSIGTLLYSSTWCGIIARATGPPLRWGIELQKMIGNTNTQSSSYVPGTSEEIRTRNRHHMYLVADKNIYSEYQVYLYPLLIVYS